MNTQLPPLETVPEESPRPDAKRSKKPLLFLALLLLLVGGGVGVWLYNNVVANTPLQRVLASDPRDSVVKEHAKFDGWFDVNTLVFDVDSVSGEATRMDVLRSFLQYAEAMKAHRVRKVILACRGIPKFQMEGSYFQQLGMEFSAQNPMYTIRTLPINVTAMDGSHPYSEYEGGLLGVLSKEMEQFGDFSDRWYGKQLFETPGASK
jgi:hypothetical protein